MLKSILARKSVVSGMLAFLHTHSHACMNLLELNFISPLSTAVLEGLMMSNTRTKLTFLMKSMKM